MIVVDASVLVNALADDEDDGDRARARLLADPDLHAPSLVDLEVLSVLRRRLNMGTLNLSGRAALTICPAGPERAHRPEFVIRRRRRHGHGRVSRSSRGRRRTAE